MVKASPVWLIAFWLTILSQASTARPQPLTTRPPTLETTDDIDHYLRQFIHPHDKLAVLMDFDGTLAPINPNPVLTSFDPDSQRIFHELARNPGIFLAVISGRGVSDVRCRVGIENITYSGNHGMEIRFANQTYWQYPIPKEIKDNFPKLLSELNDTLAKDGAWVENKVVSLTYHYRDVPNELHADYVRRANEIVVSYGYRPVQAHYAIEIKPPVEWTKGDAALKIISGQFGENWFEDGVKVIFAGDDNSDEDAMRLFKGKGVAFRVTNQPDIQTYADYIMPSVKTVTLLLSWIQNNF